MAMIDISQFYSVNSHFDVNISTSSRDEFMNVGFLKSNRNWVLKGVCKMKFEHTIC